MAKISKDNGAGAGTTLHPRENLQATAAMAAANAVATVNADGASTALVNIIGTYSGTIVIEGTMDGTNWFTVPVRPVNGGGTYTIAITTAGQWQGQIGPCWQMRARMSAYTSGTATVTIMADNGVSDVMVSQRSTDLSVTVTAATGAAATLTIPAAGAGLFHYISRIIVQRHTSAALTAAATPILVTTTNLSGSRVLSFPADGAAQGVVATEIIEPAVPIRSTAANTATTIVMPLTTGVIWRATADYYFGP